MSKEVIRYIPNYPIVSRPKGCPAGEFRHPVNTEFPDRCGLSKLMLDIRASEGVGGLMSGWTKKSFTKEELIGYNFRVEEKEGEVPLAVCNKCSLEMTLWRQ